MSPDVVFIESDDGVSEESGGSQSHSESSDSSQAESGTQASASSDEIMVIDLVSTDSDNSSACDNRMSDDGDDEPTNGLESSPRRKVSRSNGSSKQNQPASSNFNKNNQNVASEVKTEEGTTKKKKKKKKKANQEDLSNPEIILKTILDNSQFKVPNLSQAVEEKFNAPGFKGELKRQLKAISYKDVVGSSQVDVAVLPSNYIYYNVNVDPFAITSLARAEKPVDQRKRRRGNRGAQMEGTKKADEPNGKSPIQQATKQRARKKIIDNPQVQQTAQGTSHEDTSRNLNDGETLNQVNCERTGNRRTEKRASRRRKARKARLSANEDNT